MRFEIAANRCLAVSNQPQPVRCHAGACACFLACAAQNTLSTSARVNERAKECETHVEGGSRGRAGVVHVVAEGGDHEGQLLGGSHARAAARQPDEPERRVRHIHAVEEVVVRHLPVLIAHLHPPCSSTRDLTATTYF